MCAAAAQNDPASTNNAATNTNPATTANAATQTAPTPPPLPAPAKETRSPLAQPARPASGGLAPLRSPGRTTATTASQLSPCHAESGER